MPQVEVAQEDFPGMHDDNDAGMEGFPGLDETEDFPEPSVGKGRPPSIPALPNRLRLHSTTEKSAVPVKQVSMRRASTIISNVELKAAVSQSPPPSKQVEHSAFSKLLANVCDAMKEIRVQHSGFLRNLRRFAELYVDGSLETEDFVQTVAREMPAPTRATEPIKQAVIQEARFASNSSYNTVKKFVVDKFGEAEFVHHDRMIQNLLHKSNKLPPAPPPRNRRRTNSGLLMPTRSLSSPVFASVPVPQHHRSATAEGGLSQVDGMATASSHQRNHSAVVSSPQKAALVPPSRFGAQSDSETCQTWGTFCNTPSIATLFSNFKAVAISNQNFAAMLDSSLLPGQADLVALGSQCSAHADLDYHDVSEVLSVHRTTTSMTIPAHRLLLRLCISIHHNAEWTVINMGQVGVITRTF